MFIVKFFDSDEDSKLSYSDFLQLFVPCDNNFLRCQVTQREPYKVEKFQYLPIHIETEVTNLITSEIELFRKTEDIRIDLARRHDFSTFACFRAVDDLNEGDVNPDNLRTFFKSNGYYPTEEEVIAIVRRLDLDADCKVNYAEFSEAIKTQEFSKLRESAFQSQGLYGESLMKEVQFAPASSNRVHHYSSAQSEDMQRSQGSQRSSQSQKNVFEEAKFRESQMQQNNEYDRMLQSQSNFGQSYNSNMGKSIASAQSPLKSSIGFGQASGTDFRSQQSPKPVSVSPLKKGDEQELITAFKQQMILDRGLEKQKIDLIESCRDFNLFDTFRILDRDAKGQISAHDLKDAFDTNKDLDLSQVTIDDIELIMARYDKDGDRKLRFSEFSSMFCPVDQYFQDQLIQRKACPYAIEEKTHLMYRSMWLAIIQVEQQSERIRERLLQRSTFSVFDAFKAVDSNNDGKITADELASTLERSGFHVTFTEIKALIERYDKDGDGAISYLEFSDEIRPHSPGRKAKSTF